MSDQINPWPDIDSMTSPVTEPESGSGVQLKPGPGSSQTLVYNYFINDSEFTGWQPDKKAERFDLEKATLWQSVWVNQSDPSQIFKTEIFEAVSDERAAQMLNELLSDNMRPMAELKKVPDLLGPYAFVNNTSEMQHGIFRLANMVLRVKSVGHTDIACNDFITRIYQDLNQAENQSGPAPDQSAGSTATYLTKGKAYEIPLGGTNAQVWYKIILNGTGDLTLQNGVPAYTPAQPGSAELDIYTIKEFSVLKNVLKLIVN